MSTWTKEDEAQLNALLARRPTAQQGASEPFSITREALSVAFLMWKQDEGGKNLKAEYPAPAASSDVSCRILLDILADLWPTDLKLRQAAESARMDSKVDPWLRSSDDLPDATLGKPKRTSRSSSHLR